MSVFIIKSDRVSGKGGRRSGIDRREFSYTAYGPERRKRGDRRKYEDRRQKSRILTAWKHDGSISVKPRLDKKPPFLMILKSPEGDDLPIMCKKVWSGKRSAGDFVYNGIGLIFTEISSKDRETIASLVEKYSQSWLSI